MPGILPMKVIRVGNNSQSRIAQACDRCRSKKIRCDGIRPCCTQCSNVGFECKTSDKLSRRAFPRGYTESLEDRVRNLESEVRELKDLLDEKDEKIDMLSRIHNFSPSSRKCSTSLSPANSAQLKAELQSVKEEVLHVETTISADPDSPSLGASSTAAFVDAFEREALAAGKDCPGTNIANFNCRPCGASSSPSLKTHSKIPPRLLTDQYINIFFQEWQPLLPILYRPSVLRLYGEYLADPDAEKWHGNRQGVTQLFLLFEVAALSFSASRNKQGAVSYEPYWRKALHSLSSNASVATIQCHLLAQLCYLLKADYAHLACHRAIAVGMCHQLGLHQSHKYHTLTTLEAETRKKVFWCQYVLDKFASAATGTPMLLHDGDITTEYPADVDDENLTAEGFSPALPGELTKISSALALFKLSRLFSKVLEQLYPAKATYQLSMTALHAISDELDLWSQNLSPHLRLKFSKDKPSTNMTSCRSPLLSLAYFYVRGLIHRQVMFHGSGSSAASSTIVLATAGKHILQILDLLDERRMNYTFPFNKAELLLTAGFSLLWQCLGLEEGSKLVKDNQKSLNLLVEMLIRDALKAGIEFHRVASSLVVLADQRQASADALKRTQADRNSSSMSPPEIKPKSTRKQLHAIASRISNFSNARARPDDAGRRATVPLESYPRSYSTISLASSTCSAPLTYHASTSLRQLQPRPRRIELPMSNVNLDYFPIGDDDSNITITPPHKSDDQLTESAWEQLITNFDSGTSMLEPTISNSSDWHTTDGETVTMTSWPTISQIDLLSPPASKGAAPPQSVLSFTTEDSMTSNGEDLVFSTCASANGSTSTATSTTANSAISADGKAFQGIAIPLARAGEEDEEDDDDGGADVDHFDDEFELDGFSLAAVDGVVH